MKVRKLVPNEINTGFRNQNAKEIANFERALFYCILPFVENGIFGVRLIEPFASIGHLGGVKVTSPSKTNLTFANLVPFLNN